MATIDFQTSCYENSYDLLLNKKLLSKFLDRFPDTNFKEIRVIINNVADYTKVGDLLEKNYPQVKYYLTLKEIDKVFPYFGLKRTNFLPHEAFFSAHHFIGIYYSSADYIFHVSEDCDISSLDSKFITDCIDILERNDDYISAMPLWGKGNLVDAKAESIKTDGNFFICNKQTDQIYIGKRKILNQHIYNYGTPVWYDYPEKGGNSFEKRLGGYMWRMKKYRAVHKLYHYVNGFYDDIIKPKKEENEEQNTGNNKI